MTTNKDAKLMEMIREHYGSEIEKLNEDKADIQAKAATD
jgi:hypothetical protein